MDLTFGLEAFTVDPVKDLLAATAALSSMILNFSTLPFVFQTGKFQIGMWFTTTPSSE